MRNRSASRFVAGRRGIAVLVAFLSSALAAPHGAAMPPETAQPVFRAIAHELLSGIGSANVADLPAVGGYGKPRIAVAPLRVGTDAVSAAMAAEINDWLLAELTQQGNRNFRFVAPGALDSILRDVDPVGEVEEGSTGAAADLMRSARVDILIVGGLREDERGVRVSYKAVSVDSGIVFAATQPRLIRFVAAPRPIPVAGSPPAADDDVAAMPPHLMPPVRRYVMRAQRLLLLLGYHPGPVDGVMRPVTRDAIRAFERDAGVAVTGRMTRVLMRALQRTLRADERTALALP